MVKTNWPELKFDNLKDTIATMQLWTQIVGKIRLVKTPWLNHSWHVTLYVSAMGLTTGSIPYKNGLFQIDFDFTSNQLIVTSSANGQQQLKLSPRTVASFYQELFEKLQLLEIYAEIYAKPNEIEVAIPFKEDHIHCHYDESKLLSGRH